MGCVYGPLEVVGPTWLFRRKFSFVVLKSKCMGSYLENHLQKNLVGAPLYSSGSVYFVWYNKLLNLEGFREIYLIFAMEGKNWAQGYF